MRGRAGGSGRSTRVALGRSSRMFLGTSCLPADPDPETPIVWSTSPGDDPDQARTDMQNAATRRDLPRRPILDKA